MFRDLYYAVRQLRQSGTATMVAVLALALGIGANVSSFIGLNAILLKPFPYPDLDRIMTVWESVPKFQSMRQGVAAANFFDWEKQNRSFEQLSAYRPWSVNRTGADTVRGIVAAQVTLLLAAANVANRIPHRSAGSLRSDAHSLERPFQRGGREMDDVFPRCCPAGYHRASCGIHPRSAGCRCGSHHRSQKRIALLNQARQRTNGIPA